MLKFCLLLIFFNFGYSQTLTGVISDNANKPLESANIIAIPSDKIAQLKFAISDNKGRFKLELEAALNYEVTASYIGYLTQILQVTANSTIKMHNFALVATGENLKEIKIKHDYKPIIVKKDTLIYDVKNFVNGNERKMKDVLEKLPGVEVDKKGGVTVQGKKVTQMLVEKKSFFGGGSKLAVENIPADAIEKIEVIDHFNQVGFLKKVSDSDELAMNVVLKSNKKKFVFGDIEAGSGVGFSNNYLLHAGLFYYSPKTNICAIGDANDIGKSTFTFEDLMRFDGGVSSFLNNRKSNNNLFEFTNDNTNVVVNKSRFLALNLSQDVSSKISIIGYGIFSKIFIEEKTINSNSYLQNNSILTENRFQNNQNKSNLGIANFKLDYSPNKNAKWYYNLQFQASNNTHLTNINSLTNATFSNFEIIKNADNQSIKQFVEWHQKLTDQHTTTMVVNSNFDADKPVNQWITDQPFLAGLLPLQNDSKFVINKVKQSTNNVLDAMFKHYWIVNNHNHIYTVLGNNRIKTNLVTTENQKLTNGLTSDFGFAGFNNNIDYLLNDMYLGLEYKFKIGIWTNKPGVYLHQYNQTINQQNVAVDFKSIMIQPQWLSTLDFNQSEELTFNYKLTNDFPNVNLVANRFTLQSFNSVFKGNSNLQNQQFHTSTLRYMKHNLYRGIRVYGNASYTKKTKVFRNEIEFLGINQFATPVLTNNPETNWRFAGSFSKKIFKLEFKIDASLDGSAFIQKVNNIDSKNNRNGQNLGFSVKTAYKKWPDINVGYNSGFNQISGLTTSKFRNDHLEAGFEHTFFKYWTYKLEYENLKNYNSNGNSNFFEIANTTLRYQQKNSPFDLEFSATNLLNTKSENDYTVSDFMTAQQSVFIMPRILFFSISYKL